MKARIAYDCTSLEWSEKPFGSMQCSIIMKSSAINISRCNLVQLNTGQCKRPDITYCNQVKMLASAICRIAGCLAQGGWLAWSKRDDRAHMQQIMGPIFGARSVWTKLPDAVCNVIISYLGTHALVPDKNWSLSLKISFASDCQEEKHNFQKKKKWELEPKLGHGWDYK